jgi:hypothetical protein
MDDVFDRIESSHQELKKQYLDWAKNKKDCGIGSQHNSLTLDYINNHAEKNLLKHIRNDLKELFNNENDIEEQYLNLRELYLIHPSFHECWFFSSHFNHQEIIKGRLGLKAYLTCSSDNQRTIKGVTTFLLKRGILLENLYSSQLKKSIIDHEPVNNVKNEINSFLDRYNEEMNSSKVLELLPDLFAIVKTLLEETDYFSLDSVVNFKPWITYAPCSINEGPIFTKKSDKSRVDIFKSFERLDEYDIRGQLKEYFHIQYELYNHSLK